MACKHEENRKVICRLHRYLLQVKAAEITETGRFKTGVTLRFPRVEKIRTDKNWFDCMTTAELDTQLKVWLNSLRI